jgi:excisionase family DNA binding protein
MQNKALSPEKYPIVVQVIENYLTIYAPDFDYRVAEPYRPADVGQTEMMIMKVRREIASKLSLISHGNTPLPSPTKGKQVFAVMEGDTLTTREVATLLRVSEETVRRLAARGSLNLHTTPGGHRRFLRSSVQAYLEMVAPRTDRI